RAGYRADRSTAGPGRAARRARRHRGSGTRTARGPPGESSGSYDAGSSTRARDFIRGTGLRRRDRFARMMSMRALECLVTIVDQGSLTQAAAVLHMSQPALSHQIAAIAPALRTPLIH